MEAPIVYVLAERNESNIAMTQALQIIETLSELRNEKQRNILMRFFKTGPGQYGEGDQFLGVKVPEVRAIAKMSRDVTLEDVAELLVSEWHEVRLCGFLILTYKMERLSTKKMVGKMEAIRQRDQIVRLYLEYADYANNWDLVDLSAPKIIGPWLLFPSEIEDKDAIMDSLADSPVLWRQRIAMVSTWRTTQQGHPEYAIRYAERLVNHKHDLMHKAVGWMLREVGKRGGMDYLEDFLEDHAATMPRTALRYAIEQMPEDKRQYYMNLKTRCYETCNTEKELTGKMRKNLYNCHGEKAGLIELAIDLPDSMPVFDRDNTESSTKPVCQHNPSINCPCPKDCPRHGKCCACVAHHREHGKLPACLRTQDSRE